MHFSVAVAPIAKNLITGTIHHDNGNNTRLQCCAFQKWLPRQFVCVCVSWRFFAEAEGAIHWWSVLRGIGQRRVESRQDSLNDTGWWAKAAACWQPKILNKTCSYFDLCFSGLLDYCCAHQLVAMDFTVAFKRIPCPQQTLGLSPIDDKAIISNQMRQSALTSMKVNMLNPQGGRSDVLVIRRERLATGFDVHLFNLFPN